MNIGIPQEIKEHEYRVAATPGVVHELTSAGHSVFLEADAGAGSGFEDEAYEACGATIVGSAEEAWAQHLVLKVKEPVAEEYRFLRPDLILFTFLHLAANRPLTEALLTSGTTAIAYETVESPRGSLPLLTPMSEVAGRIAAQVGSHYLSTFLGGRGVLLGGVPGVIPGKVVILGGGVVGTNAAKIALGLGAHVTVIDVSHSRLQYLDDVFAGRLQTLASNRGTVEEMASRADLLIGAVLVPGALAPLLVSRQTIQRMKRGSVVVDVTVDQGGCIETISPTTHEHPTYEVDGVIHYGVTNMPGAVPRTSTLALSSQTLPYFMMLANAGLKALEDNGLRAGLMVHEGRLTSYAVGQAFNLTATAPNAVLPACGN